MITDKAASRLFILTVACVILFMVASEFSYAQRGYLAVGGEYGFLFIPAFALAIEISKR